MELMNARLNANVTADKIKIADAVVKSLNCKELTSEEGVCLVVSEYLNFEKAVINPEITIYGQPGAYLKFGEIDSDRILSDSNSADLSWNKRKTDSAAVYRWSIETWYI